MILVPFVMDGEVLFDISIFSIFSIFEAFYKVVYGGNDIEAEI